MNSTYKNIHKELIQYCVISTITDEEVLRILTGIPITETKANVDIH
jgi:hypothetical protein